ncbi:L,D-transpeptidase [Caldimonas sp. KR1-144]|uniref:L,D-transpeptidase n=1 Tax=Caldimonas sp. KR1-144 TaxID=3400911 RepID=UPI003C0CDF5F
MSSRRLFAMLSLRRLAGQSCLLLILALALASVAAARGPMRLRTAMPAAALAQTAALSSEAQRLVSWVRAVDDSAGAPFAVIDKRQARLWVFDGRGTLRGSTPILLGAARGDRSVPGIGTRPINQIRRWERTTPAGRFAIEPGRNARGEDIFWVDYDAAISMHRVRATNPAERRLQRLATRSVADNRISYGCINVPVAFFERVIQPQFGRARGVVYILPEQGSLQGMFASLAARAGEPAPTGSRPLLLAAAQVRKSGSRHP